MTGNIICPLTYLGPESSVGVNNLVNTRAVLEHESTLAGHCHMAPGSIVCGRSHVGEMVMLGASATVIDKVNVAAGTQVGAGAVVVRDIDKPSGVFVGVPARRL